METMLAMRMRALGEECLALLRIDKPVVCAREAHLGEEGLVHVACEGLTQHQRQRVQDLLVLVCVRACVRACVGVCARACGRARACGELTWARARVW